MDKATLLEQIRGTFADVVEAVAVDPKFVKGNE
jgi:hypothetical protein